VPIAAKLVANMLVASGVDRVLTMDLHAEQIQGFFDIPVDNIYALPILLDDIRKQNYENPMVVSPDHGGVVRARSLAKRLECDLAIIDKRRPKANVSEVMNIIGEVDGRTCIIMDDMVDTAGTLCKAATALKARRQEGRRLLYAPGAFRPGVERVNTSDLDALVVTDTIPLRDDAAAFFRASASFPWPKSWPKPFAGSATTTPSRRCSLISYFELPRIKPNP
jgi:ribose-phosphate pyrophosphokinase